MLTRLLVPAPVLLSLLVLGCEPRPPEEEQGTVNPPSETMPQAPQPWALAVPIPSGLWESGAVVTVSRLHESRPARESVTVLSAGTQEFKVEAAEGEVLAVSVQERTGGLVEAATASKPSHTWPGQGKLPRVLLVPQHYASIQAAVDAAGPGDTVRVLPGTYVETVHLKSGIRLLGSGAERTFLDGGGKPVKLVDFSGASDVVVSGFTFQNVGYRGSEEDVCFRDVMLCAGTWYPAGVFADGHAFFGEDPTSGLITHNVFRGNHIALMLYFHARAVIRNNIFTGNTHGFVANHFQDVALVANNVFWDNAEHAIVSQAAYLDILNNVIARSDIGILHGHVQTGRIRCNAFFQNGVNGADIHRVPPRFEIGQDGNLELEPRFENPEAGDFRVRPGSPLIDAGCFEGGGFDLEGTRQDVGAYGGALGQWP